jgi:hypothetical protein
VFKPADLIRTYGDGNAPDSSAGNDQRICTEDEQNEVGEANREGGKAMWCIGSVNQRRPGSEMDIGYAVDFWDRIAHHSTAAGLSRQITSLSRCGM